VRARDPCCLISGFEVVDEDFSRFKAAHIFPRAYDKEVGDIELLLFWAANVGVQWSDKGFPSLITDPAPLNEVGGAKKIDSIQNVLLLRSDLHDAWDNYKFAVNPDVCDFPLLAFRY
jgi:hypothetical protein